MTQDEFRKGCVEPIAAISRNLEDIKRVLEGEPRYKIKGVLTRLEEIETLLEPVETVFTDPKRAAALEKVFNIFTDPKRLEELEYMLTFRGRFEAFRAGLTLVGIMATVTAVVTVVGFVLRVLGVTP